MNEIIWTRGADFPVDAALYGCRPGTRLLLWLDQGKTVEVWWLPSPGDGGHPLEIVATGHRLPWRAVTDRLVFVEEAAGGPAWDGAPLVETNDGRLWARSMAGTYIDPDGGPNLLASELDSMGVIVVLCDHAG